MKLSSYVYRTGDSLVNLTTKKVLPLTASEEELRDNLFLEGQESDALHTALFGSVRPPYLSMKVTPTYRCNLRCKHCSVLQKLTRKQEGVLDLDDFMTFVRNFHEYFRDSVKTIACYLVGGEVTLETGQCLELTERVMDYCRTAGIDHFFAMTTNGLELDKGVLELINRCDTVTISVDGDQDSHNAQRRAAIEDLRGEDLYERTLRNIRRIVKVGLRDKIAVQAALRDTTDADLQRRLYRELVASGVRLERIKVGSIYPTAKDNTINEDYKAAFSQKIKRRPCCMWRTGEEFVIDENNMVYTDYFQVFNKAAVGKLTDPIPTIIHNHEQQVRQRMPILSDNKCLSCPVVGACWGDCCNIMGLQKPSDLCDQQGLVKLVEQAAEAGALKSILHIAN